MHDRIILCDDCGEVCEKVYNDFSEDDGHFDYECPECGWWICEEDKE